MQAVKPPAPELRSWMRKKRHDLHRCQVGHRERCPRLYRAINENLMPELKAEQIPDLTPKVLTSRHVLIQDPSDVGVVEVAPLASGRTQQLRGDPPARLLPTP